MTALITIFIFLLLVAFSASASAQHVRSHNRNDAPTSSGIITRYEYPQNRCYSCMSTMYAEFFDSFLSQHFIRPLNFTSACDASPDPSKLQLVKCRTICLTISAEFLMLGRPTGNRLFMRGCALSLSKRGLNNRTLSMFDKSDRCRNISASDLFYHGDVQNQPLRVCSCLGDKCNGTTRSTSSHIFSILFLMILGDFY